MNKKDLRIVYLGTPDFAVESLNRLVAEGFNVVGVVTAPDKPVGRHQNHLQPSAVKVCALEHGLPLLQPERLKDESFLEALRALRADLQIVVAFRMLPEAVWAMPRLGTFNLHASLLPQYRGAAPINWAIINGEKETGVTTFFLKHDIDTGDIIDQVRVPIGPEETFGELHDRLMHIGADLTVKTVNSLLDGTLKSRPQPEDGTAELKPAPKIFRDTCRIDWHQPMRDIHNFIRGLSPAPTAWTMLHDDKGPVQLKIFRAQMSAEKLNLPVGEVSTEGRSFSVSLADGHLKILDLQLAGKKRMPVESFLNGFKEGENNKLCVE
jgi:methionyl-tRNA formyltransferase